MQKPKVEFLDKSDIVKCWKCDGKGTEYSKKVGDFLNCSACKGSGTFKEDTYFLIATNEKGKKIAFLVDGLK